jgi:hypothetical protein
VFAQECENCLIEGVWLFPGYRVVLDLADFALFTSSM